MTAVSNINKETMDKLVCNTVNIFSRNPLNAVALNAYSNMILDAVLTGIRIDDKTSPLISINDIPAETVPDAEVIDLRWERKVVPDVAADSINSLCKQAEESIEMLILTADSSKSLIIKESIKITDNGVSLVGMRAVVINQTTNTQNEGDSDE